MYVAMEYMHVNYNMCNYFALKSEQKMDSIVVIVLYKCIAQTMIERIWIIWHVSDGFPERAIRTYDLSVFAKQVNSSLRALWLDNKKYISTAIYFLAFMRDGTCAFFRYKAFFTILEHLKLKFSISI